MVVDGYVRDAAAIRALGFPAFARGLSPLDTFARAVVTGIDVEARVGGVEVRPGDLVVGDVDVLGPVRPVDDLLGVAHVLGGGGGDTFQWRGLDMDGGTDYLVDFNVAQNDRIDLGNLLTGYTTGANLANWVSLSNGLTAGSAFEGGTGSYSRLQIDRDGLGNFSQTEQTLVFRGNALSGYANAAAMLAAGRLVLDNTAPTVTSLVLGKTSLRKGETTSLTLTFSEAVTGLESALDVLAPSGSLSAMSSSDGGTTWTGTFTPTDNLEDASNVVQVLAGYADWAGNAGTAGSGANYQVDTRAPALLSTAMSASSLASDTWSF